MKDSGKDISDKILKETIKKASKRAVDESFALGLSILIARSGKLIRVYPDGNEEVVKTLEQKPRRTSRKRYKIGA